MLKLQTLLLGLLATEATTACPGPASSGPHSHRDQLIRSLDDTLRSAVLEKRVPGITAIGLTRDGTPLYNNSFGVVNIADPSSAPITASTKMQIFSMTKAVVSVAALQLVEQGKLFLDDPVEKYLPVWKNISVLAGFTPGGQPILRKPKSKAKILNLFTHTAGSEYFFTNANINKWQTWAATQSPTPTEPLAFDPATGWHYGMSIDTLGNVVEEISGLRLDAYIDKYIFQPLGIKDSGLIPPEIFQHQRQANGTIASAPPATPSTLPFGGGYLTSTLNDYETFLLPLINSGRHPVTKTRILKSETVRRYLFPDLLPQSLDLKKGNTVRNQDVIPGVGVFDTVVPELSNSGEILPGTPKGWSVAWLRNNADVKGRRREGSGTWAGVLNTYFWVDDKSGRIGVIMTNLGPFLDKEVLALFDKLEAVVYKL